MTLAIILIGWFIYCVCALLYEIYNQLVNVGERPMAKSKAEKIEWFRIDYCEEIVKERLKMTGLSAGVLNSNSVRSHYRFYDDHTGVYRCLLTLGYKDGKEKQKWMRSDSNWFAEIGRNCENRTDMPKKEKPKPKIKVEESKYCEVCGVKLSGRGSYCSNCGTKIE